MYVTFSISVFNCGLSIFNKWILLLLLSFPVSPVHWFVTLRLYSVLCLYCNDISLTMWHCSIKHCYVTITNNKVSSLQQWQPLNGINALYTAVYNQYKTFVQSRLLAPVHSFFCSKTATDLTVRYTLWKRKFHGGSSLEHLIPRAKVTEWAKIPWMGAPESERAKKQKGQRA